MNTSIILPKCRILQTYSPIVQLKRFRGKINIQRPRQPHYERALFNAVTEPKIPQPTIYEKCHQNLLPISQKILERSTIENPYEKILAKDIRNRFEQSKMTIVFHVNSINADDWFKARVAFHKENMQLKTYGKALANLALHGTRYKPLLPLFQAKYCVVFAPEQKVNEVLKISKKIPQLILLAGIVENRLMSKTQITDFAAMPSLTVARAQFVGVLNGVGGTVASHLEAHQKNLVALLDVHANSDETKDS